MAVAVGNNVRVVPLRFRRSSRVTPSSRNSRRSRLVHSLPNWRGPSPDGSPRSICEATANVKMASSGASRGFESGSLTPVRARG
jgi:hypothetical protein